MPVTPEQLRQLADAIEKLQTENPELAPLVRSFLKKEININLDIKLTRDSKSCITGIKVQTLLAGNPDNPLEG